MQLEQPWPPGAGSCSGRTEVLIKGAVLQSQGKADTVSPPTVPRRRLCLPLLGKGLCLRAAR